MALRGARIVAGVVLLLCSVRAHADDPTCPARTTWPDPDWASDADSVKVSRAQEIAALEQFAFTLTGYPADHIGIRTDSILILKHGRIVYEKYARGYSATMKHLVWSCTKNYLHALTGIAIKNKGLTLDDSICKWGSYTNQDSCKIHVADLLNWASGLDWKESYENESNQVSSVLAMLYGVGHGDMANFVAGHPLRDTPGTTFEYSTGDATLLANVLAGAFKDEGEDWPWKVLFTPIGMNTLTWERDAKNTFVGGSYVFDTPRDLARFGYLYLNDGCWEGTRLLPEGWVASAHYPSQPFLEHPLDDSVTDVAGPQWWLNVGVSELNKPVPYPSAPLDMIIQEGHWGQFVFIIPSLDVVIVRLGDDRNEDLANVLDTFLKLALAVAKDGP